MSKIVKERIIYITNILLGVLTLGFLFVPFMTSNIIVETSVTSEIQQFKYNGWDILFNLGVTKGWEIEGMFLLLCVVMTLAAVACGVMGVLALKNNIKDNEKFAKKKLFILLNIAYTFCAFATAITLVNFVKVINTTDNPIPDYSLCEFACVANKEIQYFPCIFILLGVGVVSSFMTCIFSGMAKDNSLVLPYTKREIATSFVTIFACILVFFIPLFNFVFDTNYINTAPASVLTSILTSGSDLSNEFNVVSGYTMFYLSGGGMPAYIKIFYFAMLFTSIAGIIYNICFLLGALKVLHINLDRKINDLINLIFTACGALICIGCVAYSIGVNFQLDKNWETYSAIQELASVLPNKFTESKPLWGAFIVLYPVIPFLSVKLVNNYLD